MSNDNKVRLAHELLDEINARQDLTPEQTDVLRSFLPELPQQMTLEEIIEHVNEAWAGTRSNTWWGDGSGVGVYLEDWLSEMYVQLNGLKDTPTSVPALPAGMRLADHEEYGRVVVSPGLNDFGLYLIFVLDSDYKEGAHWHCEHGRTLTFIDHEPAKPAHPEFLETEADYASAPEGTITVADGGVPSHKFQSKWSSVAFLAMKDNRGMSRARRRVLRWGK